MTAPIARGPLLDLHRRAGATIEIKDGWQVAIRYPQASDRTGNVLVDLSHWPTFEINGPETGAALMSLCSADVPLRKIHSEGDRHVYRLTPSRAIVFGDVAELVRVRSGSDPRSLTTSATGAALDVTGGWSSLAMIGAGCGADFEQGHGGRSARTGPPYD